MKIEPQAKCSSSHPPSVGPIATPRPATADHMAMALARSAGTVKTFVRMDSVAGMIAAAPIPITTREAMSSPAELDMAASAEPSPKTTRPPARVRCRPMRSPRLPKDEQQPGHGQGVGVDDPLQRAGRGVQLAHQRGQGHVDDGAVHHHDEQGQAEHGEGRPAAGVDLFGGQGASWFLLHVEIDMSNSIPSDLTCQDRHVESFSCACVTDCSTSSPASP